MGAAGVPEQHAVVVRDGVGELARVVGDVAGEACGLGGAVGLVELQRAVQCGQCRGGVAALHVDPREVEQRPAAHGVGLGAGQV